MFCSMENANIMVYILPNCTLTVVIEHRASPFHEYMYARQLEDFEVLVNFTAVSTSFLHVVFQSKKHVFEAPVARKESVRFYSILISLENNVVDRKKKHYSLCPPAV